MIAQHNTFQRLHVYGIVQGVGFRPFVDLIAARAGVAGSVCNKGPYVEICVGGTAMQVADFKRFLTEEAPERSSILKVEATELTAEEFEEAVPWGVAENEQPCDAGSSGVAKNEQPIGAGASPEAPNVAEGAGAFTDKPFRIIQSEKVKGDIFVSPDIATCSKCQEELFDPKDRRYLHPFINCTACGPRLTILDSMPYDRVRTSMKEFPMCPECEAEYTSPKTRRYHAQPVCCNDCGPELYLALDNTVVPPLLTGTAALLKTREVIRNGGIVAIKGIGGFHLCCDATNEETVARLRELKNRPFKPFAVMLKDMDVVRRECKVLDGQEALLTGPQKPILLLEKLGTQRSLSQVSREPDATNSLSTTKPLAQGLAEPNSADRNRNAGSSDATPRLCPSIAPDNPNVGVMLPYTPVHMLLFHHPEDVDKQGNERPFPDCLVMTSANPRGAPICRTDEDALETLSGMCDLILSNNRDIRLRADDSVLSWWNGKPYMIRRSRGYAPLPFMLTEPGKGVVLGIGGELKNTFCIAKDNLFYPSPYIGDMADLRSVDALKQAVRRMCELLEVQPDVIVCDKHPLYHSSEVAKELAMDLAKHPIAGARNLQQEPVANAVQAEPTPIPVLEIQHHYAHTLSCMADNDYLEPAIGVSFDGTGYGTELQEDGTELPSIWGGEFLIADTRGFTRAGSIAPFPQAGGDASSKEGWRIAVSLLKQVQGEGLWNPIADIDNWNPSEVEPPMLEVPSFEELVAKLGLCNEMQLSFLEAQIEGNINCVPSTSVGRVFDAASAILGFRRESTCEGEASMVLEFAAERWAKNRLATWASTGEDVSGIGLGELSEDSFLFGGQPAVPGEPFRLDTAWHLFELAVRRLQGEDPDKLAYKFHSFIADLVVSGCIYCREQSGLSTVALSGGVFQNLLLTEMAVNRLKENDFTVLTHSLSAPNDGGIGLGQALYGMTNTNSREP